VRIVRGKLGVALVSLMAAASCSTGAQVSAPGPVEDPTASTVPEGPTTEATAPTTPAPPPVPGALPAVDVPVFPGDDVVLPVDPDVRIGTLDNGLTYFIRRNTAPGGRAELRLAIDAGSGVEDDDQAGVAHFLEHMLFNGTERYPANELVAVLESFGSEFGPDVNAYTSIDETVYELSVPTDDADRFVEAVDVMVEWATNATIDADEVVAERGVVLEEWRLRGQGLGGRIGEMYENLVTPGTPYENRLPIGNEAAIAAMSPDVLERFYNDWYRPDLMAVVVVGDVDVDAVEALVRDRFGPLTNPADPRPLPEITLPDAADFTYTELADPEMPNAFVEVFYEGQSEPIRTVGDNRRAIATALARDILGTRFDDDVSRGEAPYLSAYPSSVSLARDLDAPSLLAEGPADSLESSLEALLVELERVRSDGFGDGEFERAVAAHRAGIEQAYAGRATTQDADYAREYVERFVGEAASLSWDDFIDLERRLLDDMTPEYVAAVFLNGLAARAPQVIVVGPASSADDLPSETIVRRLIDAIVGSDVEPRVDASRTIDSLMDAPDPAEPSAVRTVAELGDARLLEFDNGVTVLLKQTTIAENQFTLRGDNPGGTSVLPLQDLPAAFVASDVVTASGVGDLDQVELDRLLADDVVFANFVLDETAEVISAGGASENAELALQLVHQYLTAPRVQESAIATAVGEVEPFASDPGSFPFLATSVELLDARYGGDDRYRLLPGAAGFASITADDVERVFTGLLGDASGSVFAIAGDFDMAEMEDLAARYLGTLPSDGSPDAFVDNAPAPPGAVERRVAVGQDAQAEVTVLITAELEIDQNDDIEIGVLQRILNARLRDRIREALGATYSPVVTIASDEAPDAVVETFIQVSGEPARVDEIVDEIEQVLADIRVDGVTGPEVATAREQVRRDFELVSNEFWLGQMLYSATHPEVTILTVGQRIETAGGVTAADLDALIAEVLPPDAIVIVRVPA
jgi:zinc protease